MNKKGSYEDYLLFIFIGIILICFLPLIFINNIQGKTGEHTGIVTAVQYQKNIMWNEELAFFKTSEETTQEHKYCIDGKETKEKLIQASRNKTMVTIHYDNPFFTMRWDCNGGVSIIKSVEFREEKENDKP